MTVSRYFHLFSAVPLAVHAGPIALAALGLFPEEGLLREIFIFLGLSAFGLLVYLPFMVAVSFCVTGLSEWELYRLTYRVPWYFAATFLLASPFFGASSRGFVELPLLALAYGYAYVGLLLLSARFLRRFGVLSSEADLAAA